MLTLPPAVRIILSLLPTDMRRSFDGLAALVESVCRADPFSGHLFVFSNKRHDRVKILYWDHDGYVIWYKRLEEGRFRFPTTARDGTLEMRADELGAMLAGIDLSLAKRSPRYQRPTAKSF